MEKKPDNMALEVLSTLKKMCIVGWTLLFLSQVAWLIAWNLPSEETTQIEQENESGYNNYIGEDGDINYGKTSDNENDKEKQTTKEQKQTTSKQETKR